MRNELTKARLHELMAEIARTAPRGMDHRVYLVGGGTAVLAGWQPSSLDADLCAEEDSIFQDIQGIKKRLNVNVEFARPEHFVPPLCGSDTRHVFVETVGRVSYFHYDPYAQILFKVVRGFDRDLDDAHHFVGSGMVDPEQLLALVQAIPDSAYARYPSLSRSAVVKAVEDFLADLA